MKLQSLRALLAAVETGSLRNAARRLGVSQPALTKAIRELELELGAPLLLRSNTGVATTPQGRVLADRAKSVERELAAAVDQIRQLGGEMVGSLHVAAVPLALMLLVPEALRTFSASYPGIRLRIDEELYMAQLSKLRAGEVEVAVGPMPQGLPAGDIVVEPLMPIQMVVVTGKSSPLARAKSLEELSDARWVFTGTSADGGYAKHLFAEHGLPVPKASAVVNSTLGLVSLICGGDFVGLMPRQIAAHPLAAAYMRTVPIKEGALQAAMAAMTRPESALVPAVRQFIAHLSRAAHHFGHLEGPAW
ncbi:LysR family transcriptional regulator [Azohydromonas lata]|uniref:LysR family transcriptional regulator n=1 Tax=Azohydromonas lata TaxID=45677 RepID=UPI00082C2FFB|nr:LysR family transcriptional regulator [Azohydromonas lata]